MLQVEKDKFCNSLLSIKWPEMARIKDVRCVGEIEADLICGGDPCQSRSSAKGSTKSRYPDLSGYFLSLAGRSGARWVVRENVPARDVKWFAAGLAFLGYRVVIVQLDARDFTAQSRRRQFVVGCACERAFAAFKSLVSDRQGDQRYVSQRQRTQAPHAACITSHAYRLSESDTLIYEDEIGIRLPNSQEAERLQGFPTDWTAGFSDFRRFKMIGNAVPPPMVEWLAKRIIRADTEN